MNTPNFLRIGFGAWMMLVPAVALAAGGGIGSGRLLPSAAAAVGLTGIILGRQVLRQNRQAANGKTRALVATVLGLISLMIGGLHAANAAGGFGTGNGLAGAIVAILLGLIGTILGGAALARIKSANKSGSR
jgi:xanthosine utilization system XapX-like protein